MPAPRPRKAVASKSVRVEPSEASKGELYIPADLAFTPVPRARNRSNGLTPLKQRIFIENLAGCGSVVMAAALVGASENSFYQLRKAPGAESFNAAWDTAVDGGARRVLDLLIEHAIHGTPETLLKGGEIILERRKYNTRAMMWIVTQRFPELFGSATGLMELGGISGPMKKLKAKWEAEFKQNYDTIRAAEAEAKAATDAAQREVERRELLPAVLVRIYQSRVAEERRYRLNGQTLYADHAARSLVHLELYMEFGGLVEPEITAFFDSASNAPHPWESEASKAIEAHRHAIWAQEESELGVMRPAPVRHTLLEGGHLVGGTVAGGPTSSERSKARRQAEAQMAEAQRLWEACATEAGWADRQTAPEV